MKYLIPPPETSDVLQKLRPNASYIIRDNEDGTQTISNYNNPDGQPQPSDLEIYEELEKLKADYPMKALRAKREEKLAETDWWAMSDRTMTSEQTAYRQALRDLPSTASPTIENGQLSNVTWPTKPE
tara:strand:- start:18 stop:398 length:381 start_codon:yes stop_codon:yes gene_type:complete